MKRLVALACLFAACSCEPEPDPLRLQALHHLRDARPAARIAAMRTLARNADRAELAAIVRASEGASVEVRVAAARAMGQSSLPESVEFLGALLLEPEVQGGRGGRFSTAPLIGDDEVSAVAVEELAKKPGPKAKAYLARSWDTGGPRTRALLVNAGPEVLASALDAETRRRTLAIEEKRDDPRPPVRAEALAELARHGTPEALAEVERALSSDEPVVASAAARALATVGAAQSAGALAREVEAGRMPAVVEAGAEALLSLGLEAATPALAAALRQASGDAADALLTSLEMAPATDEIRSAACAAAGTLTEPSLASRAARLAGAGCQLPLPTQEDPPQLLAARFAALAGASVREPEALALARASLEHADADVVQAAAGWLALAGEKSDGQRLYLASQKERVAVLDGRHAREERTQLKKDAIRHHEDEARRARAQLGVDVGLVGMPRRLATLLAERRSVSDVEAYSPRPGHQAVIVIAAAGAARLGIDISSFVETMLSDGDVGLRLAAVALADGMTGPKADALRDKALANDDPAVASAMAVRNLNAGRDGALEQVVARVPGAETAPLRMELATALAPHAAKATPALLTLARGRDLAVPEATWALREVAGDEVTQMFLDRLDDHRFLGALDAVYALEARPGDAVVAALVDAAAHPVAEVQVAALEALAARGDCHDAAKLKPLEQAFEGRVRSAAVALAKACAK